MAFDREGRWWWESSGGGSGQVGARGWGNSNATHLEGKLGPVIKRFN